MERHQPQFTSITGYRALLIGATGLVGSSLLRRLLAQDDCRELTILTRRPLDGASARAVSAAG
ncbi:NAD-dependent epimerase/dehydratase family protein, partial [Paenibacillus kobensis]|uniref:NAD-dependent epimerase/dehydratase family protein n=1 Tax=Paenibacillus kobensis TaxID=59841 RepID=UPI0038996443